MTNKAKNIDNLQWPLTALVEFDYTTLVDKTPLKVAFLPDNAIVVGVSTHTDVAFSGEIDVKLPDDSALTKIKAKADTVVAGYPKQVAKGGWVTATPDAEQTVGHGFLRIEYVVPSRGNESAHPGV